MKYSVLGSGSKGNCVFVESGKTAILIDGGFSGKEIDSRLRKIGRDIETLDAIFVTHEHHDHIAGVGVLSRRCRLPVFANSATFRAAEKRLGKLYKMVEFSTGETLAINDLQLHPFSISHDTADPVGFVVKGESASLGYCTDTGKSSHLIEERLADCNALILEFNHDPVMLRNGPYPLPLQQRVRSNMGHLANEDAAVLLHKLYHNSLKQVVLAHLSETNNDPRLAMEAAMKALPARDEELVVSVATQSVASPLISLGG